MNALRSSVLIGLATALVALAQPLRASGESTVLKGKEGPSNGLVSTGSAPLPFTLQDIDGKPVQLSSYVGQKAVLLVFWSLFCGPCRDEIPQIDQIGKKYADRGLEILSINMDGPKREKPVRAYMESNGFSFRVLWEEMEGISYKTADAYGVAGTPSVVLVAKNGKVSWTHVGREEPPVIEEKIRKALDPNS